MPIYLTEWTNTVDGLPYAGRDVSAGSWDEAETILRRRANLGMPPDSPVRVRVVGERVAKLDAPDWLDPEQIRSCGDTLARGLAAR